MECRCVGLVAAFGVSLVFINRLVYMCVATYIHFLRGIFEFEVQCLLVFECHQKLAEFFEIILGKYSMTFRLTPRPIKHKSLARTANEKSPPTLTLPRLAIHSDHSLPWS